MFLTRGATLCVLRKRRSAVFAVGRGVPGPSVRQSRSCIVSIRLKISSNFFPGPGAPSV